MEQFQQPLPFTELDKRGHSIMREAAIGLFTQAAQLVFGQAALNERQHHLRGQFRIGKACHRRDLGLTETRPFSRKIQAAIAGKACQGDSFEIERGSASSGRDILHCGMSG